MVAWWITIKIYYGSSQSLSRYWNDIQPVSDFCFSTMVKNINKIKPLIKSVCCNTLILLKHYLHQDIAFIKALLQYQIIAFYQSIASIQTLLPSRHYIKPLLLSSQWFDSDIDTIMVMFLSSHRMKALLYQNVAFSNNWIYLGIDSIKALFCLAFQVIDTTKLLLPSRDWFYQALFYRNIAFIK